MSEIDLYKRYFVFSQKQYDMRMEVENKKLGQKPKFGTVVVNGSPKVFTEIVRDMNNCKFSDAIVLTSGDIRKIKYTEPS
jgi:hypothetical protein